MRRKPPEFADDAQERAFWERTDSTDYVDWHTAEQVVLPSLRPSLRTISIRLPQHLVDTLKMLANKRDVPYQTLLKIFLAERVERELHLNQAKATK